MTRLAPLSMWIQVYDQSKRGPRGEAFCQLLRSLNKCKQSCISLRQALRRPVSSVSGRRRKHGCGCQSWSIRRASFVSSRRPFGMVLRRYLRYPAPQRMQPAHGKRIFNLDDGCRLRMGEPAGLGWKDARNRCGSWEQVWGKVGPLLGAPFSAEARGREEGAGGRGLVLEKNLPAFDLPRRAS